jgi:hypothetical protein
MSAVSIQASGFWREANSYIKVANKYHGSVLPSFKLTFKRATRTENLMQQQRAGIDLESLDAVNDEHTFDLSLSPMPENDQIQILRCALQ